MGRVIDMMKQAPSSPAALEAGSGAASAAAAAASSSSSWLSRLFGSSGGFQSHGQTAVICITLLFVQAFLQFAFSSVLSIAAEAMSTRLRKKLFGALIRKDITFFDRSSTGA